MNHARSAIHLVLAMSTWLACIPESAHADVPDDHPPPVGANPSAETQETHDELAAEAGNPGQAPVAFGAEPSEPATATVFRPTTWLGTRHPYTGCATRATEAGVTDVARSCNHASGVIATFAAATLFGAAEVDAEQYISFYTGRLKTLTVEAKIRLITGSEFGAATVKLWKQETQNNHVEQFIDFPISVDLIASTIVDIFSELLSEVAGTAIGVVLLAADMAEAWIVFNELDELESSGLAETVSVEFSYTPEPGWHEVSVGMRTVVANLFSTSYGVALGQVQYIQIDGIAEPSTPEVWGTPPFYAGYNASFSALSTDPNNDRIKYEFNWHDLTPLTTTGFVYSGDPAVVPHAYAAPGPHEVTVRSIDIDNMTTDELGTWNFVVEVPPNPGNLHPFDMWLSSEPGDTAKEHVVARPDSSEPVYAHLRYLWNGAAPCGAHHVKWRIGTNFTCEMSEPALAAHTARTAWCVGEWVGDLFGGAGEYDLIGILDSQDEVINETSETDNTYASSFHVRLPPPPPNDDQINAIPVDAALPHESDITTAGTTVGATNDGGTTCGTASGSPDVWYVYTAEQAGKLDVDLCGSSFDTVLAGKQGGGVPWDCNDDCQGDPCGGDASCLSGVSLAAGTNYRIRISSEHGATGDFTLRTRLTPMSAPTVSTDGRSAVGASTATLHGTVTDDGGEPCEVRFRMRESGSSDWGLTANWFGTFVATGYSFSEAITGLYPATTYEFQAGAENPAAETWGPTVSFTTDSAPRICVNATALIASAEQGQNAPTDTFEVWNCGGQTLDYDISIPADTTWLTTDPTSGVSNGGHHIVNVSFQSAGLEPGTYTTTIRVDDANATPTSLTITVDLTIDLLPAPAICLSPLALLANGQSPDPDTFEVWNCGAAGTTLVYSISEDADWFECNTTGGTSTSPEDRDTITVTYDVSAGQTPAAPSEGGGDAATGILVPANPLRSAHITVAASGASNTPETVWVGLYNWPQNAPIFDQPPFDPSALPEDFDWLIADDIHIWDSTVPEVGGQGCGFELIGLGFLIHNESSFPVLASGTLRIYENDIDDFAGRRPDLLAEFHFFLGEVPEADYLFVEGGINPPQALPPDLWLEFEFDDAHALSVVPDYSGATIGYSHPTFSLDIGDQPVELYEFDDFYPPPNPPGNFVIKVYGQPLEDLPPVADAGGPYAGTVGVPVNFDATASYDGDCVLSGYMWDWEADGVWDTEWLADPTAAHTYAFPFDGAVRLQVNDTRGGIDITSVGVSIAAAVNQPPIADAGGPYVGAVGEALNFDASASSDPEGGALAFMWDWTNDGIWDTGWLTQPTVTHTYAARHEGKAGLQVTDGQGAIDVATTGVDVAGFLNELPVADAGGPYAGAPGDVITFDASASSDADGTLAYFRWDFERDGDWDTGWLQDPIALQAYADALDGTARVQVVDNLGGFDIASAGVQIMGVPNLHPQADAGGPYDGIVSQEITLDASASSDPDGSVVAYRWDWTNDGAWDTDWLPDPVIGHVYVASLLGKVRVEVRDDAQATDSVAVTATITRLADLDRDGTIDEIDFAIFLVAFSSSVGDPLYHPACDLDGDGTVTLVDYQLWLQDYRDFVSQPQAPPPVGMLGDVDADGDLDLADLAYFTRCIPDSNDLRLPCALKFDLNADEQVDLFDYDLLAPMLTGP